MDDQPLLLLPHSFLPQPKHTHTHALPLGRAEADDSFFSLQVDSTDLSFKQIHYLQWAKCTKKA